MNTQLKQFLIAQIDDSVKNGYFDSEQEAVETALMAIRENEIVSKIQVGLDEVEKGEVAPLDGVADRIIAKLNLNA